MSRHGIPEDILHSVGLTDITDITNDFKELPAAAPFPVSAMPESCRRLIEEGAAAIGCPPDFVGLPMLAVLASAIGNSRVLRLKRGWEEGVRATALSSPTPAKRKPRP
jgi:hypothetical protein